MEIVNPIDYQVGDFVLFDGEHLAFSIFSALLGHYDKTWKALPEKPWHVAFLSRKDLNGNWLIAEANGSKGVQEAPLSEYGPNNKYLVFRWFDTPIDELDVHNFIQDTYGIKYDNFWGYAFTILWFFHRNFPRIIDRRYMCWEYLYCFADTFGKPIDVEYDYPFITVLMTKIGYPGYTNLPKNYRKPNKKVYNSKCG
jgi:hypothetical protein